MLLVILPAARSVRDSGKEETLADFSHLTNRGVAGGGGCSQSIFRCFGASEQLLPLALLTVSFFGGAVWDFEGETLWAGAALAQA